MTGNRGNAMKQIRLDQNLSIKKTRKRELLEEMERVVPWAALVQIVEPHGPRAKAGRPPFAVETMLRIHYLQQRFGLSEPAMEEALHDMPPYREFAKLGQSMSRLPDETDHYPEIPASAGAPRPRARHAAPGQRHPGRQEPAAAHGCDGGRHADRCAEFDQELGRRARS
jgi:hypothetical protein